MNELILEKINEIHFKVRKNFVELTEVVEEWTMPPSNYDGSQTLRDDCDGFCLACRTLLRQAGIPSRLVYCEIENSGHLVVEVNGWILDNRQRVVTPNTLLKEYVWLAISGYQAGDPWCSESGWKICAFLQITLAITSSSNYRWITFGIRCQDCLWLQYRGLLWWN